MWQTRVLLHAPNRSKKFRKSKLRRKFRPPAAADNANQIVDMARPLASGQTTAKHDDEVVAEAQVLGVW